jgi:hypothetical protein
MDIFDKPSFPCVGVCVCVCDWMSSCKQTVVQPKFSNWNCVLRVVMSYQKTTDALDSLHHTEW